MDSLQGKADAIADSLAGTGLLVLGAFHPRPADEVPVALDGARPGTVFMIGNAGPAMWRRFEAWGGHGAHSDPLDAWTAEVVGEAAPRLGASALFPFSGPPYLPFQRWAERTGRVWPSPIGIRIHESYGLWHAYRAALVFAEVIALAEHGDGARPCDACPDRPCLTTCPVGAFRDGAYNVSACAMCLDGAAGSGCMALGCAARRACPVGREYIYEPAQAALHMQAFHKAHRS